MVNSSFYFFNVYSVLLTICLSFLGCYLAVEFSRKLRITIYKFKKMILYSFILGFTFWFANLLIVFSVGAPVANQYGYFLLNFLFSCIGAFVSLYGAQREMETEIQYIATSLSLGLFIIFADYGAFTVLYHQYIEMKPVFVAMACLLIFGMSFSLVRFLIQITREEIYSLYTKWKYIGCLMAGISLGIIPYLTLISFFDFSSVHAGQQEQQFILLPFILLIGANIFLTLIPDLFGEVILKKNVESYKSLFNHNPDAVFSVDLAGNIQDVNEEASRLSGYSIEELSGMSIQALINEPEKNMSKLFKEVINGKVTLTESKLLRKDGSYADVSITAVRMIIDHMTIGAYGIVQDITEQKRAQEKLTYIAYHDDLTDLPNKRSMEKRVGQTIEENAHFGLIYIDFDRFKRINDNYGHKYGDMALKKMSARLNELMPSDSLLARIGGDEFLAFIPQKHDIEELAKEILSAFSSPIKVHDNEFQITCSIGISCYPEDATTLKDLFIFADLAMYQAKENGANNYIRYSKEMTGHVLNRLELENDLRDALTNHSIMVYYQPKFNSQSNRMIGAEALARWQHPKYGYIPPNIFIRIAEESQLIIELEREIIKIVFGQIRRWLDEGNQVPRTSINLSSVQFYRDDLIPFLQQALETYQISSEYIEFELTESIILRDRVNVNERFDELIDMGFELSIDDFGTGYSSLSYLHKLAINRLKIDKSFIDDYQENAEVIATIISLAKQLKLNVIAEGVETREQIDFLSDLSCYDIQGYYFSPPLPVCEYEGKLQTLKQSINE